MEALNRNSGFPDRDLAAAGPREHGYGHVAPCEVAIATETFTLQIADLTDCCRDLPPLASGTRTRQRRSGWDSPNLRLVLSLPRLRDSSHVSRGDAEGRPGS